MLLLSSIISFICINTCFTANNVKLSSEQLQDIITQIWFSDTNRAKQPEQLDLNFQKHTSGKERTDVAPERLFRKIDAQLLSHPTVESLIALFDSYKASSDQNDVSTPERQAKIDKFLDEIFKTEPMKILQTNLQKYGYQAASSSSEFRKAVYPIWFQDYSRSKNVKGSSGFEHVFIGEIKNDEVSGLHNWIRFQYLEKRDEINYTGFIIKRSFIAMIQYKWGNYWKSSGSMFIGTSPEFDFAVYTLCFLSKPGQDACEFLLGDCTDVKITSHQYNQNDQILIGSAYPFPDKIVTGCKISSQLPPTASTKPPPAKPPSPTDIRPQPPTDIKTKSANVSLPSLFCSLMATLISLIIIKI